jgi:fructose-1,6-bisphosphatase/inositol monophosphatase family enzyme
MNLLVAMNVMRKTLLSLQDGNTVEKEGDSGSTTNDEELKADRIVGEAARDHFLAFAKVNTVEVEGLGIFEGNSNGEYDVKIDPLDASLNYKNKGNIVTLFPYAGVITIVRHVGGQATFDDIADAGVMSFSSAEPDHWTAYEGRPTVLNGYNAVPYSGELSLTKTTVIGEMYYSTNRARLVRAFRDQNGYLRSPGCAAIEMACVSSGQAAAFICMSQKAHELGAAYRLVTNAGGVVVDWSGKSLGSQPYDFNKKYPAIVAANQKTADWILELLNK